MAKRSKLNPRQEKFVREYVKTGNGRQSYSKAYGVNVEINAAVADSAASRMLSNVKVESVVAATMARHRTRHDYTVDTILGELDESRSAAIADKQHGPAVQATTVKARLLGMIVDRKEVGNPGDFAALDTIQAVLTYAAKELGTDAAALLAKLVDAPMVEATAIEIEEENN